ncbi:MAG TPA: hypothetical protein VMV95_00570 [Bacillota bacterium]|nr:hypothetical protein [Bacillota bacterium]
MTWINGILIPIVEVVLYGGFLIFVFWKLGKGFHNAWTKSLKYIWKYKVRKQEYSEKTISWIYECMDNKIDWYGAKKLMMVKMLPNSMINETLWIYDQIIKEENKKKGGIKHGRQFERSNSKKVSEFPSTQNNSTDTKS